MNRIRNFTTGLDLSIWDGGEQQFVLVGECFFRPGRKGSWDEPSEPDSVEIVSLQVSRDGQHLELPAWLFDQIAADETLHAGLIAEARKTDAGERENAAERRAEEARNDRAMRLGVVAAEGAQP